MSEEKQKRITNRDLAWYENETLKNFFIKVASNGMRGFHQAIVTPKTTFVGTNSIIDFINHLGATLTIEQKRVVNQPSIFFVVLMTVNIPSRNRKHVDNLGNSEKGY